MNDLKQRILEASGDIAEYSIDLLTKNDVVKEFPIIGTAIKFGLAVKSLSDRIYLTKLQAFILKFEEQNQAKTNKLISKIQLNEEERVQIGENLLLLIDRFADIHKAELLSYVFLSFMQSKISKEDFIRIGNSIDMSYSPDLIDFIKNPNHEEIQRKLIRIGFTEYHRYGTYAPLPDYGITYWPIRITDIGNIFLNVCKDFYK